MLKEDVNKLAKIDLGKYAISWNLFFVVISLSIIAGIFDGKELDSWWNLWSGILTEISGHVFPCFVFLLLDITIFIAKCLNVSKESYVILFIAFP